MEQPPLDGARSTIARSAGPSLSSLAARSACSVGRHFELAATGLDMHREQLLDEERVPLGGRRRPCARVRCRPRRARRRARGLCSIGSGSSATRVAYGRGLAHDGPRLEELGPSGAEDAQRHVGREPDDVLDQVEERRLRPVDVVEHDDHGRSWASASSSLRAAQAISSGDHPPGRARRADHEVGDDGRSSPPTASTIAVAGSTPPTWRTISPSGQYVIPSPYGRHRPTRMRARRRGRRAARGRAATSRSRAAPTIVQSCGARVAAARSSAALERVELGSRDRRTARRAAGERRRVGQDLEQPERRHRLAPCPSASAASPARGATRVADEPLGARRPGSRPARRLLEPGGDVDRVAGDQRLAASRRRPHRC